jgi:hypothetical protein
MKARQAGKPEKSVGRHVDHLTFLLMKDTEFTEVFSFFVHREMPMDKNHRPLVGKMTTTFGKAKAFLLAEGLIVYGESVSPDSP